MTLSAQERRTLHAIERGCRADDPEFALAFETASATLVREPNRSQAALAQPHRQDSDATPARWESRHHHMWLLAALALAMMLSALAWPYMIVLVLLALPAVLAAPLIIPERRPQSAGFTAQFAADDNGDVNQQCRTQNACDHREADRRRSYRKQDRGPDR